MCETITDSELQIKTDIELSALFRKVSQEIGNSEPGTQKRRKAQANLDNIQRVMTSRHHHPKPPGF